MNLQILRPRELPKVLVVIHLMHLISTGLFRFATSNVLMLILIRALTKFHLISGDKEMHKLLNVVNKFLIQNFYQQGSGYGQSRE